ncbi:hypothetical protein ACWGB8_10485 [Kitasatospora sp. NPDC054939]
MADAERDHSHHHLHRSRRHHYCSGAGLVTHQLPLAVIGVACLVLGIVVAFAVPESDGPAWAMAVAGSLATGVLLLGRIVFARFRHRGGAAL